MKYTGHSAMVEAHTRCVLMHWQIQGGVTTLYCPVGQSRIC